MFDARRADRGLGGGIFFGSLDGEVVESTCGGDEWVEGLEVC